MSDDLGKRILKDVSRSFYLTLRLLPGPMRESASLGYLLARTSDTIADTAAASVPLRLDLLSQYRQAVLHDQPGPDWPPELLESAEPSEKRLLLRSASILEWLWRMPDGEKEIIQEVVEIIIGGQMLDLTRFVDASLSAPVTLANDDELEDYTWRVAGCVGAFWTKLAFFTLGETFSTENGASLRELGIDYGKGLQLVNILRDLPADLRTGRCYLPVEDPSDREEMREAFERWRRKALEQVESGFAYARTLRRRRLRAASVLPAMIARETLQLLSTNGMGEKVKIPRTRVYRLFAKALLYR